MPGAPEPRPPWTHGVYEKLLSLGPLGQDARDMRDALAAIQKKDTPRDIVEEKKK